MNQMKKLIKNLGLFSAALALTAINGCKPKDIGNAVSADAAATAYLAPGNNASY